LPCSILHKVRRIPKRPHSTPCRLSLKIDSLWKDDSKGQSHHPSNRNTSRPFCHHPGPEAEPTAPSTNEVCMLSVSCPRMQHTAVTRQLASFSTRDSKPGCSPSTTSESRDLPQLCSYPGRNPRVSPCTAYERSGGVSPPTIQMLSLWKQEPEGEPYGELSSLNVMY